MWTAIPTVEYGVNPPADGVPGLGWDTVINSTAGPIEVEKSGQVPGFTSELILYPGTDSGVFVSMNTNYQGSRNPNSITALQLAEAVAQAAQSAPSSGE
jgi:hypothetical protein